MVNKLFPDSVEPEYYPKTYTFVNHKGEKDNRKLRELEAGFSAVHEYLLIEDPSLLPKEFNLNKLKRIHFHLFNDLYPWAGKTRSYPMRKNGDEFTPPEDLPKYESTVFSRATEVTDLVTPDRDFLAEKLAKCLGILNIYHPFPEGNGRTQRIFISLLAKEHGYTLDWGAVNSWENMETSKSVHIGNYEPMINLIKRIISAKDT